MNSTIYLLKLIIEKPRMRPNIDNSFDKKIILGTGSIDWAFDQPSPKFWVCDNVFAGGI